MAEIIHDVKKCIGCGACTAICSTNWIMGDDNKAHPNKTKLDDNELSCNKEAEQVCPVQCITIK
jgi:ferredoxin